MSEIFLNIDSVTEGPMTQEEACVRVANVPAGSKVYACAKGMKIWVTPEDMGISGSVAGDRLGASIPGFAPNALAAGALGKTRRASVGKRIKGYLMDALISLPVTVFILVGVFLVYKEEKTTGILLVTVGLLLSLFLTVVNIVKLFRTGQTIGKSIVKTQIVDKTQLKHVSGVQAFLIRQFIFGFIIGVPIIGLLVLLINIVMLFVDTNETLQDKLARTVVVDLEA